MLPFLLLLYVFIRVVPGALGAAGLSFEAAIAIGLFGVALLFLVRWMMRRRLPPEARSVLRHRREQTVWTMATLFGISVLEVVGFLAAMLLDPATLGENWEPWAFFLAFLVLGAWSGLELRRRLAIRHNRRAGQVR